MSVESHRVLIGACGWKHPGWINEFYDEDLPEDWQLGFYSNEFPVVYVAAADWCDLQDTGNEDVGLSEWADEVSETFRYILELPPQVFDSEQLFENALNKAKEMKEFCLGLVVQLGPEIINDVQRFEKHLAVVQDIAPVVIDSGTNLLSAEFQEVLAKENISEVWKGDPQDSEKLKHGSLAVARVCSDELEPVKLRQVVEGCLAASNEHRVSVLCFEGNPPSLEKMRNADIILNLL